MTQETRSYDINNNLTLYALDEDGDGQNDYISTFTIKYDAQGRLTEYNYAIDWQGDGITDESWTYHSRTYDENGNLRSLAVNYDGGQTDLLINYDPNGQITSYSAAEFLPFFITPVELELSVNDSSGRVFEVLTSPIPETFVFTTSSFKGYVNDTLVVNTISETSNYTSNSENYSLYDFEGQLIYESRYSTNRGEGTSETAAYTYDADDRIMSRLRSYEIEHLGYSGHESPTIGTLTTNYDTEGKVISEIKEESEFYYDSSEVSRSERTLSYDTTGNLTAETTTLEKDYDGDGNSDYKQTTNETYTYAGSLPSDLLRIELYDAKSNTLITTLQDGDQISLSTLGNQKVAIAAFVAEDSLFSGQVESVFLNLNDGEVTRKENVEPYTLFSDFKGNFQGGVLPVGENTMTFDLYSQNNLKGDLLATVSLEFTIV